VQEETIKFDFKSGVVTPEVKDNDDGTYDVTYYPPPAGSTIKAHIKYDGNNIPDRLVHDLN